MRSRGRQRARGVPRPLAARDRVPRAHGGRSRATSRLPPRTSRIIDIDYCVNASAIHHLEPDRRHRGARVERRTGTARGHDARSGGSPREPSRRRPPTSRCCARSSTWLLDGLGAHGTPTSTAKAAPSSTTSRSGSCSTPARGAKAIIDQMVNLSATTRSRSPCGRAPATRRSRSRSRTCATRHGRARSAHALQRGVRPDPFTAWADLGTTAVSSSTSTPLTLEQPSRPRDGPRDHPAERHDLGGPGRQRTRAGLRHDRGPTAVQHATCVRRAAAACTASRRHRARCPTTCGDSSRSRVGCELDVLPESAEQVTLKLFSPRHRSA